MKNHEPFADTPTAEESEVISKNVKKRISEIAEEYNSIKLISMIVAKSIVTNQYIVEYEKNIFNETPAFNLLIDCCLNVPTISEKNPSIDVIDEVHKLLNDFFNSKSHLFHKKSDKPAESINSEEFLSHFARMQSSTNKINKEKYPFQMDENIRNIYCKLDKDFRIKYGFSVTDANNFGKKIIHTVSKRIQETIFLKYEDNLDIEEDKLDFRINDMMLFLTSNNFLLFDVEEFCKREEIPREKFEKYLQKVSCVFGDADIPENVYSKFLIDFKPIILIGEQFFCPLPDYLRWNIPIIIEKIIQDDDKLIGKLSNYKSDYLERKIESLMGKIFPKNAIKRNLYYDFEGKRRETDIFIEHDTKIIIIEAKSKKITEKFFQGVKIRLKSDLKTLIEEAFEQGEKVKEFLLQNDNATFENERKKKILTVSNAKHKRIFIVNVTLESLGHFSGLLGILKPLGLFEEKELPWSVGVYDLEVITKIISFPSIILHYMEQRIEAQHEEAFFGMEEMQLFSWYLGFSNLHPFEEKRSNITIITGAGDYKRFDEYFLKNGPKPKMNWEPEVIEWVKRKEKRREFGYTDEISDMINSIGSNLTNMKYNKD